MNVKCQVDFVRDVLGGCRGDFSFFNEKTEGKVARDVSN